MGGGETGLNPINIPKEYTLARIWSLATSKINHLLFDLHVMTSMDWNQMVRCLPFPIQFATHRSYRLNLNIWIKHPSRTCPACVEHMLPPKVPFSVAISECVARARVSEISPCQREDWERGANI